MISPLLPRVSSAAKAAPAGARTAASTCSRRGTPTPRTRVCRRCAGTAALSYASIWPAARCSAAAQMATCLCGASRTAAACSCSPGTASTTASTLPNDSRRSLIPYGSTQSSTTNKCEVASCIVLTPTGEYGPCPRICSPTARLNWERSPGLGRRPITLVCRPFTPCHPSRDRFHRHHRQ